jgi:glycosyltransferase involved in cell wall biosynthesis
VIITVVTPSLNGMRYVRDCIESTRRQASSRVQVEHIFVDGGSTDGTAEFAASHGCRVVEREKSGLFDAVNIGSFAAQGILVGFLGCDDILLPGALDAVADCYERSGRRWVMGGCRWVDGRGVSRGDFRAPPAWLKAPMLASLGWSCVPHTSTYVRKDLLEELDGFNTEFHYAGDYEFFVRALEQEPFSRVRQVLSCFRRHGANTSMQMDEIHQAELQAVAERWAPEPEWQRSAYRYLLKAWLNGTNPSWFAMKRIDRARRVIGATTGANG